VREFSPAREEKVIVMQQVTEIYGRENGWVHSSDKYIRRASATSSASLNVLPDLTCSPAIFTKLKSNIERHSQFKLGRDPLAFKERLLPEMAM